MKQTFLLVYFLLSSMPFIYSQNQFGVFYRIGCTNSASFVLPPGTPINDPLYMGTQQFVNCGDGGPSSNREVVAHQVGAVKYILERQDGPDTWTFLTSATSSFGYTFNYDYQQGSVYRIRYQIRRRKTTLGADILNPCFIGLAVWNLDFVQGVTNTIEWIDNPAPSVTLLDVFGFPNNDRFCFGDPVFMNASQSFGETSYSIFMTMHEPGQGAELGWANCGTYTGRAGDFIDMLELWQINDPDWIFWAGYDYKIQFVLHNGCNPWSQTFKWFEVVPLGFQCRTEDTVPEKIVVFPNPATDEIRIMGLEGYEGGHFPYLIADLSGRVVDQGNLSGHVLPINVGNLNNGMYIISLSLEDRVITEKFTIAR